MPDPVVPPEVSPHDAVSKDLASDAAGQPRTSEPPLPPPGTVTQKFLESGGFKVAVVSTVAVLNMIFVRPFVTSKWGPEAALAVEMAEWAWLAAFGIQRTEATLRYK